MLLMSAMLMSDMLACFANTVKFLPGFPQHGMEFIDYLFDFDVVFAMLVSCFVLAVLMPFVMPVSFSMLVLAVLMFVIMIPPSLVFVIIMFFALMFALLSVPDRWTVAKGGLEDAAGVVPVDFFRLDELSKNATECFVARRTHRVPVATNLRTIPLGAVLMTAFDFAVFLIGFFASEIASLHCPFDALLDLSPIELLFVICLTIAFRVSFSVIRFRLGQRSKEGGRGQCEY